jgi:malonyl-CoA O-methyltransferase
MAPRVLPTRQGYDRWSPLYDDEDNALVRLESWFLPPLVGEVAGLDLLDVGCGTGRHAVAWAAQGARVTGVDFSEGMLSRARAKAGAQQVRFVRHDLAEPLPFHDATFDRVLCCLVLDHVRDLPGFFREMRRVCRPRGFLVASVMHPAMLLHGVQARFTDPETGQETRPESVAHQLTDYVMAAVQAGLAPDHLAEHAVDQTLAAVSPRAVKHLGWPLLFLSRWRPVPA